jgi:V8-like Glu-specific endopeptidase
VRFWLVFWVCSLLANGVAMAQDGVFRKLETGTEAGPWEAVGRLDINGAGFCTGALIEPDLVLTAAHCLFDRTSGNRIKPENIEFLAGWRNGRASAYRNIRRAVVHPNYVYGDAVASDRVRNDIALLELSQPIRNTTIQPFTTATQPRQGDRVGVVSYGRNRAEAPLLQEVCRVISMRKGVLVTSCAVDFGSSGAPIFVFSGGTAHIASVVSAKAEMSGQNVSLGAQLGAPLDFLRAELDRGVGFFKATASTASTVVVGEERHDLGAKFITPKD